MMIKRAIYLILICALTNICCVNLKLLSKDDVKITGIILDGGTSEVMIGQGVSEFDNLMNNTMTNMNGEFEIILENKIPVIVLDGYYEPIYVGIKEGQKNIIHINKKLVNRSIKTYQNGVNLVKSEN